MMWVALSWQWVTVLCISICCSGFTAFNLERTIFKTFIKALNVSFFGIMKWDIKAFSDLYELAREDINEL